MNTTDMKKALVSMHNFGGGYGEGCAEASADGMRTLENFLSEPRNTIRLDLSHEVSCRFPMATPLQHDRLVSAALRAARHAWAGESGWIDLSLDSDPKPTGQ